MLQIDNVSAAYGHAQVLTEVTLGVEEHQIVALVGKNGAGKTTLTKTLSGLMAPSSGTISFMGERIDGLLPHVIVQKGMALVREGRGVFTNLTVRENLKMGAYTPKARKEMSQSLKRVFELFPILQERVNQMGGTLSGGEQQMLVIGRALMCMPKLLILDEPSLGLAPIAARKLFEALIRINQAGTTLLITDQNLRLALEHADMAFVIDVGRIILQGSGPSLMNDDKVKTAYMGF